MTCYAKAQGSVTPAHSACSPLAIVYRWMKGDALPRQVSGFPDNNVLPPQARQVHAPDGLLVFGSQRLLGVGLARLAGSH